MIPTAMTTIPTPHYLPTLSHPHFSNPNPKKTLTTQLPAKNSFFRNPVTLTQTLTGCLVGTGLAALTLAEPSSAAVQLTEPANALSLPTWTVHVSSVIEWITAMALVWKYGEISGFESWKGLSWGMVPLLGGAFCACTWHFFYNSESLEVLVALQAALTVIGNVTMCYAALRIYRTSEERSNNM